MDKLPFSLYDIFGYLASGFLVLMAADFVFPGEWIMKDHLSMVLSIFWTLVAYIIGQILANPAAWLLERTIVGSWLKRPNVNLFREPPTVWWVRLFPGYFTPLPVAIRNKITDKAQQAGVGETGEALFGLAFGKVKTDNDTMARLSTFLNLYGFCRNISFASLVAAGIIALGSLKYALTDHWTWIIVALVGSLGMFYRYLKFFRQYSYELFVTYASA